MLLCDAQTSGGLLISVLPEQSEKLVQGLQEAGYTAADVGGLGKGEAGSIEVT